MSRKALIRSSIGALLLLTAVAFAPAAEAGCEWGHIITTTYYAWYDNTGTDPSWYACYQPAVGPQLPPEAYRWDAIGGVTYNECEDSWDSWGDTTTCTGPDHQEQTSTRCGLICI